MFNKRLKRVVPTLVLCLGTLLPASAEPVFWADWTSGTVGSGGSAAGVFDFGSTTVNVNYAGEIAFIQTSSGANYWNPSAPYISPLVDNAPPAADIIALSQATSKTLTFSQPISDLFFAVVSLNGNGYRFDRDFEIVSFGPGYWGNGTLSKIDLGGGQFQLNGSGEPHGVIRFTGAISAISWTSLTSEYWNGFTVGTSGVAPTAPPPPSGVVPEPGTAALLASGFLPLAGLVLRRRRHPAK